MPLSFSFLSPLTPLYQYRVWIFIILLFLSVSLTLAIVAISLHNLYSISVNSADYYAVTGSFHVGAFTSCAYVTGLAASPADSFYISHCFSLNTNCSATIYWTDGLGNQQTWDLHAQDIGINCAQVQAFRAFFVLGVIFTGFTVIAAFYQLLVAIDAAHNIYRWQIITEVFGWFAAICIVISYPLIGSLDALSSFSPGPAYALEITAWVLQVIAMIMYTILCVVEDRGGLGERSSKEGFGLFVGSPSSHSDA